MEAFIKILETVGHIGSVVGIIVLLISIYLFLKGIIPVLWRLGTALSIRKMSIFAKGDNLQSLISLLKDSKLFRKQNFVNISKEEDFGISENSTLFLIYWPDWQNEMEEIINLKKDLEAMIIYAPQHEGKIPDKIFKKLDKKRNVTVTNFRGRLLNDIVSAMITTVYEKK